MTASAVSLLLFFLPAAHPPAEELVVIELEEVEPEEEVSAPSRGAWERTFGFGMYATSVRGESSAFGAGARLRIEALDWLGLDLFAEALWTHGDEMGKGKGMGTPTDVPVGFEVYLPIELGGSLRLRPLAGLRANLSLEPGDEMDGRGGGRGHGHGHGRGGGGRGPSIDDVQWGAHAGGGLEWAPFDWASVFVEARGIAYWDEETGSTDFDEGIEPRFLLQFSAGVQLHL